MGASHEVPPPRFRSLYHPLTSEVDTWLLSLLTTPFEPLESASGAELFRAGSADKGWYVRYTKHDGQRSAQYVMNYEPIEARLHGQTMTEIFVWRRQLADYPRRFALHIIKAYLLPRRGAVVSDRLGETYGHGLWRDLIPQAAHAGLDVAFVDFNSQRVSVPPEGARLSDWFIEVSEIAYRDASRGGNFRWRVSLRDAALRD